MKNALIVLALALVASGPAYSKGHSGGHGPSYGGGKHTGSHGGHYQNGSGSSHRGGSYKNGKTGNQYGHHK